MKPAVPFTPVGHAPTVLLGTGWFHGVTLPREVRVTLGTIGVVVVALVNQGLLQSLVVGDVPAVQHTP